jgi:GAF domain-containing protein
MKIEHYHRLTKQAVALIESETDMIANLSNISALLAMELDDLN